MNARIKVTIKSLCGCEDKTCTHRWKSRGSKEKDTFAHEKGGCLETRLEVKKVNTQGKLVYN